MKNVYKANILNHFILKVCRETSIFENFWFTVRLCNLSIFLGIRTEPFSHWCRRKALIACTNKHNDVIAHDVYNRKKAHKSCVYYISVLQQVRSHSNF